jgi:UPF0271 protein
LSDPRSVVDLNADLGEDPLGADAALLDVVTTAHVACGFHAGDIELMRRTVERAVAANVAVGAHPSYPDREGFGRRETGRSAEQVAEDVRQQLDTLATVAEGCGARVVSVKPHGALYHRMASDPECATAVAAVLVAVDPALAVVLPALATPPGQSAIDARAAVASVGLTVRAEAFCDRGYAADGHLVPRGSPGAVITDEEEAARRARRLVLDGSVEVGDGFELRLHPDTLCVHGDTPGALRLARAVRASLEAAGVRVAAPSP